MADMEKSYDDLIIINLYPQSIDIYDCYSAHFQSLDEENLPEKRKHAIKGHSLSE